MLVLSRKPGEKIVVGGGVTVTILSCRSGRIRLGLDAPPWVSIVRPDARAPRAGGGFGLPKKG